MGIIIIIHLIKILKGKNFYYKYSTEIFVIFRANKLAQNAKHTLGSFSPETGTLVLIVQDII